MLLKRLARRAAAIVIVCLIGTNVSYVAAGDPPTPGNSLLGGWVYIDRNNDGILNFENDPNPEWMIGGVTIELCKDGSTPCTTTQTNEFGRFLFDDLSEGTYTLREIQPIRYVNGKDTPGQVFTRTGVPLDVPPITGGDDVFSGITLPANAHADYFLFGERGLAAGYVSKRFLTGSPPLFESGTDEPGFVIPEPATLYLISMAAGIALIPKRGRRGDAIPRTHARGR
jgi:hypothetical protein